MFTRNNLIAILLLSICIVPRSWAYSTVVFDLTDKDGNKVEHKVSIYGRWYRVDTTPKGPEDYVLTDSGYQKQHEVFDKNKNFRTTRLGRLYWPLGPLLTPVLKPSGKVTNFEGIRCQPVDEIGKDEKPIAKHCMVTSGPLGLNDREMITLSRLFMYMRRINGSLEKSWIGVATRDERQISIHSEDTAGNKLEFKSVNHDVLNSALFRIPRDYKEIQPVIPEKLDHTEVLPDPDNFKRLRPATPTPEPEKK